MSTQETADLVPKYVTVKDAICSQISDGTLKAHTRVASLAELCRDFSVSKITAQRAMSDLVRDGILYRRRGVGTFVSESGAEKAETGSDVETDMRTWTFLVTRFDSDTHHYHEILEGLAATAESRHIDVMVGSTGNDPANYERCINRAIARKTNGMLIVPPTVSLVEPRVLTKIRESRIPVIACNREIPGLDCPALLLDPVQTGYLAGQHFLKLGRRRIAYFGTYRYSLTDQHLLGLKLALLEGGVRLDEERVCFGETAEYPFSKSRKKKYAEEFAETVSDMDGVLLGSSLAAPLIQYLQKKGRKVPDDIALIAVGNNTAVLADSEVPVTVVGVDLRRMGRLAGELLLRMANGESLTNRDSVTLSPEMFVRRSAP